MTRLPGCGRASMLAETASLERARATIRFGAEKVAFLRNKRQTGGGSKVGYENGLHAFGWSRGRGPSCPGCLSLTET